MTTTTKAKTFYATRDFKDTGTQKAFTLGEPIDATAGEIANYAAAGLASDAKPQTTKAADAA